MNSSMEKPDIQQWMDIVWKTDLVETNVLGLLTEALTAQVKAVLADETSAVLADTARRETMLAYVRHGDGYPDERSRYPRMAISTRSSRFE